VRPPGAPTADGVPVSLRSNDRVPGKPYCKLKSSRSTVAWTLQA